MLALLIVAPAHADAPAGFREATSLEPAASFVAGKPVAVYCAASAPAFADAVIALNAPLAELGAFASVGGESAYLAPRACGPLTAVLHRRPAEPFDVADAMLALVHEATHLRGSADESETDCAALRLLPAVASRFFGFKTWRSRHDLMADAWNAHNAKPRAYTTAC